MAVKVNLTKQTVALGVGDIVAEPATSTGRVAGLRQATRFALGREAHVEHQRAQTARHPAYRQEIFIRHTTTVDDFAVKIQGRIDGVIEPPDGGTWVVEEVKSVILPAMTFATLTPHPQHLEQLQLYCYFIAQEGRPVTGQLVYVNVVDGTSKEFAATGPFDACRQLIDDRVRALITTARDRDRGRHERRQRAGSLAFPFPKPRRYQDEMLTAVTTAVEKGRHLIVSAPSGIGKTIGALFPAMKHALAKDRRVFFVTAKNTQHQQAAETLRRLDGPTATVFRSRENMCINSIYACREEFCPHLQMLQLKLQQTKTIDRLLEQRVLLPDNLMDAGRGVAVCPFELALLTAERTDAIVCDYNYVFDPQVYFRRFFQDADYSNAILIIDEAHNLVQRALDYYSPVLRRRQIQALAKQLAHVEPGLARELRQFLNTIDDFFRSHDRQLPDEYSQLDEEPANTADQFLIESPKPFFDDLKPTLNRLSVRYLLDKIESGRAIPDDPVEEFFAELGKFYSVLGLAGEEFAYVFDTTGGAALKVICQDASRLLAERLAGFHSVIAMSATLAPAEFYRQMLGFETERTDTLILPSPFPAENRQVLVVPTVSTAFRHRGANYDRVAEIITTVAGAHAGNYMALFPSYDFLRETARHLTMPAIVQEPGMTGAQRQTVLDALQTNVPPKLVLAVQGGVFAEGVDYPGEMLSGVIVVSPALPQMSFERELMRRYYQEKYGKGFEFAYLYPGMNRVIQSVGRLIRSETDCGVAVLVCQRFIQNQYTALFPADWGTDLTCRDLEPALAKFWAGLKR
ncbi:MAG: ATP-dependent DNA helicase [Verrucomicrobiota bacterium]|jgi:DNA excision repair protein ERCC-2